MGPDRRKQKDRVTHAQKTQKLVLVDHGFGFVRSLPLVSLDFLVSLVSLVSFISLASLDSGLIGFSGRANFFARFDLFCFSGFSGLSNPSGLQMHVRIGISVVSSFPA